MKKLLTLLLIVLSYSVATAQADVYLQINHKLGSNPFSLYAPATNNVGSTYNVSRLEYYISEVVIIHDGGLEDTVTDTWILVNAANATNVLLGDYPVTALEGVRFGIGVNSAVNHGDPSLWPMGHALAPQSPSMHWGWNAGYRFVAMEGKAVSGLNQTYQIHALGDGNYFYPAVTTTGMMNGADVIISLEADYEKALNNIDVDAGLINHGETAEARDLLLNFSNLVFTASPVVGVKEDLANVNMVLAPNPAVDGSRLMVSGQSGKVNRVIITDLVGKVIRVTELPANGEMNIDIAAQGIYVVSLESDGYKVASQKLVISR